MEKRILNQANYYMKQNEILFLLGSICIVVLAWIAFTIVHNSLTSTISGTTLQAITPISATFDSNTIDAMTKRTVIQPLYTIQPPSKNAIVVTTAPSLATSSAQQATTGGALQ